MQFSGAWPELPTRFINVATLMVVALTPARCEVTQPPNWSFRHVKIFHAQAGGEFTKVLPMMPVLSTLVRQPNEVSFKEQDNLAQILSPAEHPAI